jgi:Domain of unknown function (DUF4276)
MMSRVLIHVEGETEETFVRELLAPRLYQCGYRSVSARLVGNARQRDRRGGIRGWHTVSKDILNHLREDRSSLSTTMVDYYALPSGGPGAWPGRSAATQRPFVDKARTVQDALLENIGASMGDAFDEMRFIPFVIMHEFEGLLFSDCQALGRGIAKPGLVARFQAIRNSFESPEEINDSPVTAPSKRLQQLIPEYEKPLLGTLAILEIGLDKICAECPNFRGWMERLEAWPRLARHSDNQNSLTGE